MDSGQGHLLNVNPQVSTTPQYLLHTVPLRHESNGPIVRVILNFLQGVVGPLTVCLCFRWPFPMMAHSLFISVSDGPFPWLALSLLALYVSDGPFPWWVLVIVVVISLSVSTYIIFKCFLRYCGFVSKTYLLAQLFCLHSCALEVNI